MTNEEAFQSLIQLRTDLLYENNLAKDEAGNVFYNIRIEALDAAISALRSQPRWIPCSERLPEDNKPVNITLVNRDPEPYYEEIKDRPFTATGIYYAHKWWWYSAYCQYELDEYGDNPNDAIDSEIEIIAWMPLSEPYKEGENE